MISTANKFELLSEKCDCTPAGLQVLSMLSQPLKFISDKFMTEFEDTEDLKISAGCASLYCTFVHMQLVEAR